jgi:hypothetical protein
MKLRVIIALSSAALLTLALALVSSAGPTCTLDADGDGICESNGDDNCSDPTTGANPAQRDDDEDGYGNLCDYDVDQNCTIGGSDLSFTFGRLLASAPWSPKNAGAFDVDENGTVGGSDLSKIFSKLLQTPGPTTRSCADCSATPTSGLGAGVCPAVL